MPRILALAFGLQAGDPSADGMKALEAQKYEDAAKLFADLAMPGRVRLVPEASGGVAPTGHERRP